MSETETPLIRTTWNEAVEGPAALVNTRGHLDYSGFDSEQEGLDRMAEANPTVEADVEPEAAAAHG